ncbi:MAG: polysaccharide pyruvyl transferase CsaB [Clostridia bacterium]|jgi:polysaccharide pyruvyl transferase CsaB|nr:polysaccharide pyruvyl transferase CsaB [Clostridia bacterium]
MKKIVISGYYGFDNAGDEAILYSIVESFKDEYEITVLSNNPEKTKKDYGVKSVDRWNILKVTKAIRESDLLISGGGSLLQDATSIKNVTYYLAVIKIAQVHGKKVVVFSQGVGPVNKKINRHFINKTLNKVDKVFVRDENSKKLLLKFGIDPYLVVTSVDPVIKVEKNQNRVARGKEILSDFTVEDKKTILISVRDWHFKNKSLFVENITKVLNGLSKEEYNILFLPMHYPKDIDISDSISKNVEGSIVLKHKYNTSQVIDIIAASDFLIGMRLHSLIIAAAMEVPHFAISYDPKIESFVNQLDVTKSHDCDNIDYLIIIEELKEMLGELDKNSMEIYEAKKEVIKKANLPVDYINSILK